MDKSNSPTVIAGAGIIGAALAFELARRGEKVVLIDKQAPGMGASYGNMASIAINGFDAVSRMATWKKIPYWLANPEAPVAADPRYLPKMIPWMLRFLRAGLPGRVREIEAAGATLATRSLDDLKTLLDAIGARDMLSQTTCLSLYGTEQEFRDGQGNLEMMARYGLAYEVLSGAAIRDREPLLNPEIAKAVVLPQNHFISDPHRLVNRLVEAMQAAGGALLTGEVGAIQRFEGSVTGVRLKDGRLIETDKVAVSMGVLTRDIAALSGETIPLETERGYHTQIMAPGIDLAWSLIWPDRAFMITPTAGGIRVGGSVEMAGLEKPPNWRRAQRLVDHARYALPGLKVENTSQWMGHRPAMPDTIPVISPSARTRGLYYSAGHGHLGLTYAATNALVMADIMTEKKPAIDLKPFSITRF